jgi:hypothetical protein
LKGKFTKFMCLPIKINLASFQADLVWKLSVILRRDFLMKWLVLCPQIRENWFKKLSNKNRK